MTEVSAMNWQQFATAVPDLAAIGRKRLETPGLALVGTLRKDGWPRVSPVEPYIVDGELVLGMMWQSKKALDLGRDPRMVVHSVTCNREGADGDFKLYGRAGDVRDPVRRQRYGDAVAAKVDWRPKEPYHLFTVDITSAAYVIFGEARFGMTWDPLRGLRRWTIGRR
jgi:hypothetical protein